MRSPADVLRDEHRVILVALTTLARAAERLAAGGPLPGGWWEEMLDWLRAFADRNHHAKEEKSLFPAMVKAGVPGDEGPIAVMLEEHVQGRLLIQAMASGHDARRSSTAREYVHLLRDHIAKEDEFVFPLADSVLDDQAVAAVAREFEAVQIEQGRDASIDYQEAVMKRLGEALG
jgi:hemerythrin-like domain-containing protein